MALDLKRGGEMKEIWKSKKQRAVLIVSSIVLMGVFLFGVFLVQVPNYGNPIDKYLVEKHTTAYFEEVGYSEEDMEVESFFEEGEGWNDFFDQVEVLPEEYHQWQTLVTFSDEKERTYIYGLNQYTREVVQFCENIEGEELTETSGKHTEEYCAKMAWS